MTLSKCDLRRTLRSFKTYQAKEECIGHRKSRIPLPFSSNTNKKLKSPILFILLDMVQISKHFFSDTLQKGSSAKIIGNDRAGQFVPAVPLALSSIVAEIRSAGTTNPDCVYFLSQQKPCDSHALQHRGIQPASKIHKGV